MCTVAIWSRRGGGWCLAGNRDELQTRPPAEGPRAIQTNSVTILAPRDPEGGGSWVAVNDRGLGLSLLNAYQAASGLSLESPTSRGQLVMELASCVDLREVIKRLGGLVPGRYRPFVLLAVEGGARGHRVYWDGERVEIEALCFPHVEISSSVEIERARRERAAYLREELGALGEGVVPDFGQALGLFAGHEPARGPFSVCMHREDARTHSFSWASLSGELVELRYRPGAPCEGSAEVEELELSLRA